MLNFAAELKRFRERNGIKQDDLARRLNVSQSTVSMWETGAVIPNNQKLARVLRMIGESSPLSWVTSMTRYVSSTNRLMLFIETPALILARSMGLNSIGWSERDEIALLHLTTVDGTPDSSGVEFLITIFRSGKKMEVRTHPFLDGQDEYVLYEINPQTLLPK